jgi:hypothetical protein
MIGVIAAAMAIGSLTVWLVMRSSGGADGRATGADTALARLPAGSAGGASRGVIVTPLGAEAAELPPETPPEMVPAPAPAPVPASPAGAQVPAGAQPSAGAQLPAGAQPPAGASGSPLDRAMNEQRYADAVAICSKELTADTAASCTLAACYARVDTKARAWLQRAPAADRARLTGLCRNLRIDLQGPRRPAAPKQAEPSAEEKCERNPMACQH